MRCCWLHRSRWRRADGDDVDAEVVEPAADDDDAGCGLRPMEKVQDKVRCFESRGCFAKLAASDGRPFRFIWRYVPTYIYR